MIPLAKPCRRVTRGALDGFWGADRGRHLVASLEPGDLLTIRPLGTRRAETVSLFDIYRWAITCRANGARMEKLREKKAKKAARRERARLLRSVRSTKPD